VDASGRLLDGRAFQNVRDLKAILRANPRQLARNLLQQFTVYATGTPVRFFRSPGDRVDARCVRGRRVPRPRSRCGARAEPDLSGPRGMHRRDRLRLEASLALASLEGTAAVSASETDGDSAGAVAGLSKPDGNDRIKTPGLGEHRRCATSQPRASEERAPPWGNGTTNLSPEGA